MNSTARPGVSGPSRASTLQVTVGHEPHRDVQHAVGLTGLVHRDDVRVVHCCRRPRLGDEPLAVPLVLRPPGARILSATSPPSRSSRAWNTTAIPPAPSRPSSRYPASSEPARNPASCAGKSSLNTPPRCRRTALNGFGPAGHTPRKRSQYLGASNDRLVSTAIVSSFLN